MRKASYEKPQERLADVLRSDRRLIRLTGGGAKQLVKIKNMRDGRADFKRDLPLLPGGYTRGQATQAI